MSLKLHFPRLRDYIGRRGYFGYVGLALAVALLIAVIVPLSIDVVTSLRTAPVGSPGSLTLANYRSVLGDPTAAHLLLNTLIYAVGSASIAMILASVFAWTVTRVALPARRILRVLPLLSLAVPNLLKDIAWIQLYSSRSGLANLAIDSVFHTHTSVFNIYSMFGLIVVTGVYVVPVPYLIMLAPFESLDLSLEEASVVAGVSRWRTLVAINARVLVPALLSAYALSLIVVASTFEAPQLIGLPAGVTTYMSAIYRSLTSAVPNFPLASAQAAWYLCLTFVIFLVYLRATRREQRFVTVTGRGGQRTAHVPDWLRVGLVGLLLVYFALAFVLPIALTAMTLFVPIYQLQAGHFHGVWNLHIIRTVLSDPVNRRALSTSIEVAFIVSFLAVAAGGVLSFIALKTRLRGRRLAEFVGMLPISMPGMVISVMVLITFLGLTPLRRFYETLVPMIFVDTLVALPFTTRIFSAALIQIDGDLLSASLVCGASSLRTLRQILMPLMRKAGINAFVISFVIAFRELGAVILIIPANRNLIPPLTWIYWTSGDYDPVGVMNALTVVVPLCIGGAILAIVWIGRRVRSRLFNRSLNIGPDPTPAFGGGPANG
jgi:iron(III) transport system permease protein